MTEAQLFDIIWGWVDLVINKDLTGSDKVLIVFSDQNAPVQKKNYIVISKPLDSVEKSGTGNQGKADENGIICLSDTWAGVLNIQEVASGGDWLRKLENTLTRQYVREYFEVHNFSVLRSEPVLNITRDKGKFKILGASVDIHVAFTDIDTENTGYIETVENIVGTYNKV